MRLYDEGGVHCEEGSLFEFCRTMLWAQEETTKDMGVAMVTLVNGPAIQCDQQSMQQFPLFSAPSKFPSLFLSYNQVSVSPTLTHSSHTTEPIQGYTMREVRQRGWLVVRARDENG
jgi:hypothetical protein